LNGELPLENQQLWITVEEMHDRLIEGGVDRALTIDHLRVALIRGNRSNIFLNRRMDNEIIYYRPSSLMHEDGAPIDQRKRHTGISTRGLPVLPPKDYFYSNSDNIHLKVEMVNEALIKYEEELSNCEYILYKCIYIVLFIDMH